MVDIAASARSASPLAREVANTTNGVATHVEVATADLAHLDTYAAFCSSAVHGVPQHPLWIKSWVEAAEADAIMVTLRRGGEPMLAAVLEIVREGPFRIARFPSGGHANGNFVALSDSAGAPVTPAEFEAMRATIAKARPDIDLVQLERQKPITAGRDNPLSPFATTQSPNISLATDLTGGLDALLERMNGKRKRKKFRLQLRKLEAAGEHRWFKATTPEEVDRLISEFFVLKAARFRKRGIPDVFAPAEVQTFFRRLFLDALAHDPLPFDLYGLEVSGQIYNVKGFSHFEGGMVSEFCAMRDDDDVGLSPGFYMDYVLMEQAGAQGLTIYDFSVGDEEYKRSWCELETWLFDIVLPLTLKGRVLFGWKLARAKAVRSIKSNDRLWSLGKRLRTRLAGSHSPDQN